VLQPPPTLNGYNAVILALGTNEQYESEGQDRSFRFPEQQDRFRMWHRLTLGRGSYCTEAAVLTFNRGLIGCLLCFMPGSSGNMAVKRLLRFCSVRSIHPASYRSRWKSTLRITRRCGLPDRSECKYDQLFRGPFRRLSGIRKELYATAVSFWLRIIVHDFQVLGSRH